MAVGGEKGGVGKSSIAIHFALMRAAAGREVILVDADPQKTSSSWCYAREQNGYRPTISCVEKSGKGLGTAIQELASKYEDIIIDTGGRDSVELRLAMTVASIFVSPINCSAFDWWSLEKVDTLIGQASLMNPALRSFIVLNQLPTLPTLKAKVLRFGVDAIREAGYMNISFTESVLSQRFAYQFNTGFGSSIFETSPLRNTVDAGATAEMTALYQEIFGDEWSVEAAHALRPAA